MTQISTEPGASTSTYLGLATLMRMSLAGQDMAPLYQALIQRAQNNASDANALLDAATILRFFDNAELAEQLQSSALELQRVYRLPAHGQTSLRVLAIMAPGPINANVPIECLLENSDIELNLFYAPETLSGPIELPDHDLLFIAIGESEANRQLLHNWLPQLDAWPLPKLLNPHHLTRVARDNAATLLHPLAGVLMPPTQRIARGQLMQLTEEQHFSERLGTDGMALPLIIRPLDSHAGHDLYRIDTAADGN